jgi:hypothetical protein
LTASDRVAGALIELWQSGRKAGFNSIELQAIADRWVFWDEDDNPWPRALPDNVTPLRR